MKVTFEFEVHDDTNVEIYQEALTKLIHEGEDSLTEEEEAELMGTFDMKRV